MRTQTDYIPAFAFPKANFFIFAGRTSAALQCKSENDQLMTTNKQMFSLESLLAS